MIIDKVLITLFFRQNVRNKTNIFNNSDINIFWNMYFYKTENSHMIMKTPITE